MAKYLLDTNICIYVQRRRPVEVLCAFDKLNVGDAAISVVTHGELVFGAQKSSRREYSLRAIEEFVALVPPLSLPVGAAAAYGIARAELEKRGHPAGNNDLWIAAHALAADLILVTNNEREFKRIAGLKIENWTS